MGNYITLEAALCSVDHGKKDYCLSAPSIIIHLLILIIMIGLSVRTGSLECNNHRCE